MTLFQKYASKKRHIHWQKPPVALSKPESAEENVLTFQKRIIWSSNKQPRNRISALNPPFATHRTNSSFSVIPISWFKFRLKPWGHHTRTKQANEKMTTWFTWKKTFKRYLKPNEKKNVWGVLIFDKQRLSLPIYFSQSFVPPWEWSCPYLSEQVLERGRKSCRIMYHPDMYFFLSLPLSHRRKQLPVQEKKLVFRWR